MAAQAAPPGEASMPESNGEVQYLTEDWLPDDFQPMSFQKFIWQKITSAPLVAAGVVATCASFGMAAYHMKLGNSQRFNYWLRWRVGSQAATIGAMMWYGGVAWTRAKQDQINIKTQVLLGDLPRDTPIPYASNNPFEKASPRPHPATYMNPEPEEPEGGYVPDPNYPLPPSERMRISDFAARLRRAEHLQREEDAAMASGDMEAYGGAKSINGQLMRRNIEREQERLKAREAKEAQEAKEKEAKEKEAQEAQAA